MCLLRKNYEFIHTDSRSIVVLYVPRGTLPSNENH